MKAARRPTTTATTMSAFHLVFVFTSSSFGRKGSARQQGETINMIEVILVQWKKTMEVDWQVQVRGLKRNYDGKRQHEMINVKNGGEFHVIMAGIEIGFFTSGRGLLKGRHSN